MFEEEWINPNWKTLIADDHESIRDHLARLTNKFIGSSDTCMDGNDAIQLFTEAQNNGEPYDLLLLDIEMPGVEGPDIVEHIRDYENENNIADEKRVKIVLVTGFPDEEHIKEWFTTGHDQYLVKPISKEKLLDTINRIR